MNMMFFNQSLSEKCIHLSEVPCIQPIHQQKMANLRYLNRICHFQFTLKITNSKYSD